MSKSEKDPSKKHRHDIGAVDHGPSSKAETTRAIQVILGMCIVSSAALTIYALTHVAFAIAAP